IGMDLGSQKIIDKIIWFNDSMTEYDQTHCGIDKYTELNLTVKNTCLVDYSYDEREFSIVGTGIDVGTGKWDFEYREETTVSGLFSSSDTSPTNITLGFKPELIDGLLWEYPGNVALYTNYSMGVDLGCQKEITRIRFYLSVTDGYTDLRWKSNDNNWYIYKSNDNINWELCCTMENNNPMLQVQNNSWEFISEFFFPINQTARYFKMWCVEPMYVFAAQSVWNTPICSEIKVFSEISNSYKTGIGFSGHSDSYISVPANSDFTFPGVHYSYPQYGEVAKPFTVDFHVKFNSLPVVSGTNYCTLIRNWANPVITVKYGNISFPPENWMDGATMEDTGVGFPYANYAIFVRKGSGDPTIYQMEFWIQSSNPYDWAGGTLSRWNCQKYEVIEGGSYHVSLTRGTDSIVQAYVNGELVGLVDTLKIGLPSYSEDLIIGENLDGVISDLRITKDLERTDQYPHLWHKNERFYAMSVYVSEDNLNYNKFCDLDLYKETSYGHYYYSENVFSSDYYSYFAIDLGHSYDLDIIRSFPVDDAYQFDLSSNVFYSNINTSNPALAFKALNIEDINTDFNGSNKTLPDNWNASGGPENYIFNDKLYQSINSGYVNLTADFYLIGDFDLEIEYELIDNVNIGNWFCGLQIQDIETENNSVKMDRAFYDNHNRYRFNVKDNSSSWVTTFSEMTNPRWASVKFTRVNQKFIVYVKDLDVTSPVYTMFGFYEMTGGFGEEVTLSIITESTAPDNPTISVEWDNLIFNTAEPMYSSYNDARWVRIRMLSGDGVTRTLKKIGIYPDISTQVSADNNYNTEWEALGNSITNYVGEVNVVLAADVEASSFVGLMIPDNAVNGLLTSELQQAWGSDNASTQWITVTLPQEMQIYRIKLHLGYDDSDTDHMIQDYKVQTSTDNIIFNDIFTITG
ncbi:discoidin domain-containing protein, partial [candidate division WOR-3 bacterium]|nr:discoidin domain-containing protein [candidate division WOR-3 bacterium]